MIKIAITTTTTTATTTETIISAIFPDGISLEVGVSDGIDGGTLRSWRIGCNVV